MDSKNLSNSFFLFFLIPGMIVPQFVIGITPRIAKRIFVMISPGNHSRIAERISTEIL